MRDRTQIINSLIENLHYSGWQLDAEFLKNLEDIMKGFISPGNEAFVAGITNIMMEVAVCAYVDEDDDKRHYTGAKEAMVEILRAVIKNLNDWEKSFLIVDLTKLCLINRNCYISQSTLKVLADTMKILAELADKTSLNALVQTFITQAASSDEYIRSVSVKALAIGTQVLVTFNQEALILSSVQACVAMLSGSDAHTKDLSAKILENVIDYLARLDDKTSFMRVIDVFIASLDNRDLKRVSENVLTRSLKSLFELHDNARFFETIELFIARLNDRTTRTMAAQALDESIRHLGALSHANLLTRIVRALVGGLDESIPRQSSGILARTFGESVRSFFHGDAHQAVSQALGRAISVLSILDGSKIVEPIQDIGSKLSHPSDVIRIGGAEALTQIIKALVASGDTRWINVPMQELVTRLTDRNKNKAVLAAKTLTVAMKTLSTLDDKNLLSNVVQSLIDRIGFIQTDYGESIEKATARAIKVLFKSADKTFFSRAIEAFIGALLHKNQEVKYNVISAIENLMPELCALDDRTLLIKVLSALIPRLTDEPPFVSVSAQQAIKAVQKDLAGPDKKALCAQIAKALKDFIDRGFGGAKSASTALGNIQSLAAEFFALAAEEPAALAPTLYTEATGDAAVATTIAMYAPHVLYDKSILTDNAIAGGKILQEARRLGGMALVDELLASGISVRHEASGILQYLDQSGRLLFSFNSDIGIGFKGSSALRLKTDEDLYLEFIKLALQTDQTSILLLLSSLLSGVTSTEPLIPPICFPDKPDDHDHDGGGDEGEDKASSTLNSPIISFNGTSDDNTSRQDI